MAVSEGVSWTKLVHDPTKPVVLLSCSECSALVPAWTEARLNHERWHGIGHQREVGEVFG